MTSDVKGWEQLFLRLQHSFCLLSLGRAGASKTRRLITLLSVGWLPPSVPPSGACLNRGTRVPCGLLTPPRVPPHRGCVSADRGWKPRELGRQHVTIFMLAVRRQPAEQGPTCRHAILGPWRRQPDGHCCLSPSADDSVCRAAPGLSS